MQQQPLKTISCCRWTRVVGGALTVAVLLAVPVFAMLFLGASTFAHPQPASGQATASELVDSLKGDYLVLDKPVPVSTHPAQPAGTVEDAAADSQQVETRLNNWTFTSSPPTRRF